ncbi:MAG: NAD-dependent epimerase/dehydratase family protein [Marinifilaceae bacterium]|jgi:NADH dehydrogenase|nr:NAD-dependent epimerase/dehydratase family protein [Marinifilaceae bacterium]
MNNILILGGSGFVGRNIARWFLKYGEDNICIATTDVDKAKKHFSNWELNALSFENVNIFDAKELKKLFKSRTHIINCIGILKEKIKGDFNYYHNRFPRLISYVADESQIITHISALGIDQSNKSSKYALTKLKGEKHIEKCRNYRIIRPSLIYGRDDNFINDLCSKFKLLPIIPLIYKGKTQLEPIHIDDLCEFIVESTYENFPDNCIFDANGDEKINFKQLFGKVCEILNKKARFISIPNFLIQLIVRIMSSFGVNELTKDQLELLKYDNVSNNDQINISKYIKTKNKFSEYKIAQNSTNTKR